MVITLSILVEVVLINKEINANVSQTVEINTKEVLRPSDNDTDRLDKSNDPDKSEFHSEQIDSPSTSKNLDNIDRDSEEWEELSHKDNGLRKPSPKAKPIQDNFLSPGTSVKQKGVKSPSKKRSSKKKIVLVATNKKKTLSIGSTVKGVSRMPKLQQLNNKQDEYLAVGPVTNQIASNRKSKLYSENRQLTSKTDDIYNRDGGEYIRKITQRTNTKYSNFSEFPHPIKEKTVKLNPANNDNLSKFRSRTVKKRGKGVAKITPRKNHNLKYYNIVTDLQRKPKVISNKL